MRTRRTSLAALTASAVLAGLLSAPPARAAEDTPDIAAADRAAALQVWQNGGPQVRAEAQIALSGSADQVRQFLDTGLRQAQRVDERDAVQTALVDSGPAVRAAAQQALAAADAGNPEALSTFLDTGRRTAEDIDVRVRVNQLMATGGDQVREAAQKALDSEDPAVLERFLNSEWQTQWQTDQRLKVNNARATGGPQVKAAAQKALDDGSPEALDQFLTYGWDVAAAHDAEVSTIEGLLAQAEQAAAVVERETDNAEEQAKRAAAGAAGARKAATEAAQATQSAQNNAERAEAHAKRAANAARKAAQAAQAAIDGAAAAERAANTANAAAQRASRAASKAASAASDAYTAAAVASYDRTKTNDARKAAENAAAAARAAQSLGTKSAEAARALEQATAAIAYATDAAEQAKAAASSSEDADKYAAQAGAHAGDAKRAAALARANAERATRAAASAKKYLQIAVKAAYASRDAANAAAADANRAAAAAQDSADHAVDAAEAAIKSSEYAAAAVEAANRVVQLGSKALEVYEAAREADAERLAVAKDAALESARELNTQYDTMESQADWDAEQAAKRDAETNQLIATAQNPATPPADAVAAARTAAFTLARSPGEWTREAALEALAETDDADVLDFARTGIAFAAAQDNRVALADLAGSTTNTKLATAGLAALQKTDADVAQFLRTQNYTGRYSQDRLAVNQIVASAKSAGRPVTAERGEAALKTESLQALRDFLDAGQYRASATDDRLQANQLIYDEKIGPEVKAAAQVALEGPPLQLTEFLKTGRHQAAERDNADAVHLAVVAGLMEKINELGQTSVANAQKAQSAAAKARNDATKAKEYSDQAIKSAEKAAEFAVKANNWANAASKSAEAAAASANTAQDAANRANQSAREATRSAIWADELHRQANGFAKQAKKYADEAEKSALEAGKDRDAAKKAAADAKQAVSSKIASDAYICASRYNATALDNFERALTTPGSTIENCMHNAVGDPTEMATRAYINESFCDAYYPQGMKSQFYQNCIRNALNPEFRWMTQLEFGGQLAQGFTAEALVVGGALAAICVITVVCGLVVAELVTIGDIGLNFYKLIKGDQSLSETLLKVGTSLVLNLAFAGVVKLGSVTFTALKGVYKAGQEAQQLEKKLDDVDLDRRAIDILNKCLRKGTGAPAMRMAAAAADEECEIDFSTPPVVTGLSNPWRHPQDGLAFETALIRFENLPGNLPETYDYIDAWDKAKGLGISIKTIDWRAMTYKVEPGAITSKGKGMVNALLEFKMNGVDRLPPKINKSEIKELELKLGFPEGAGAKHLAAYQKIVDYGKTKGVKVTLYPVKV